MFKGFKYDSTVSIERRDETEEVEVGFSLKRKVTKATSTGGSRKTRVRREQRRRAAEGKGREAWNRRAQAMKVEEKRHAEWSESAVAESKKQEQRHAKDLLISRAKIDKLEAELAAFRKEEEARAKAFERVAEMEANLKSFREESDSLAVISPLAYGGSFDPRPFIKKDRLAK